MIRNKLKNIFILFCMIKVAFSVTPQVYYANIGETVRLQCTVGGGQYACFSTYSFRNQQHSMVMVNNSAKYQVQSGAITINNLKETDAGFYACSSNCDQMRADQISYFLQPMTMGQPVDVTRNWIAIPPFPSTDYGVDGDNFYVVVSDERLDAAHAGKVLSDGEIAGLVIGLFLALAIVVAVITFLIIMYKRKQQKREKIIESDKKGDKADTTVDYSTIERDYNQDGGDSTPVDRDGERKNLTSNKRSDSNASSDINTRNIRGPNIMGPQDLPNIDIGYSNAPNNKNNSQRSMQNNPQININPSQRSYQNQLDTQYENQYVPRPSRDSESSKNSMREQTGILPPPPSRGPNNKIQFPQRGSNASQNPPQQPNQNSRYVSSENINLQQIIKESGFITDFGDGSEQIPSPGSGSNRQPPNANLHQIIKESGFMSDMLGTPFESEDFSKRNPSGRTGYFGTRNTDNLPYNEQPHQPEQPTKQNSYTKKQQPAGVDLDIDDEGNVTVVSARTPVRTDSSQGLAALPPTNNSRSFQQQPTKFSFQSQPQPNNRQPAHLSFSQRIETTSTPLQLPPSASLRNNLGGGGVSFKDGATDV